jgi:hypothetical protein
MVGSYQAKYLGRMLCDGIECNTSTIHLISSDRTKIRCVLCGKTSELRGDSQASIGKED